MVGGVSSGAKAAARLITKAKQITAATDEATREQLKRRRKKKKRDKCETDSAADESVSVSDTSYSEMSMVGEEVLAARRTQRMQTMLGNMVPLKIGRDDEWRRKSIDGSCLRPPVISRDFDKIALIIS